MCPNLTRMNNNYTPTLNQLKRGLQIAEQIASLEAEMAALFKGATVKEAVSAAPAKQAETRGGKRRLSPRALANIRAAQKKRWAKFKRQQKAAAFSHAPAAPKRKKRRLTPAGRARLAAAMRARWAAARKSGGPAPTARKG